MLLKSAPAMDSNVPLTDGSPEHKAAVIAAKKSCDEQGYRLTELREQVYSIVLAAKKPIGAYDIMAELEQLTYRERVAPPTVYRALEFLCARALVIKVHTLNAYLPRPQEHRENLAAILICTQCGTSFGIPSQTIQQSLNLAANEFRFHIKAPSLEVLGLCVGCDESKKQT